jgi:hypothetical protein
MRLSFADKRPTGKSPAAESIRPRVGLAEGVHAAMKFLRNPLQVVDTT